MPLSCMRGPDVLYSFELDDGAWAAIRADYRNMHLSLRCCTSAAIPKVSSLGTRFFTHKSRTDCQTALEFPEHLRAKFIIAESARAAGWEAFAEAAGADPDGNPWTADILCTRGRIKVAFEVQLAALSTEEYQTRQARYQRSGVRCLWLTRLRRNGSGIESMPPSKALPLILLDIKEPANTSVQVGGATIPIGDFVKGSLTGELFWAETRPGRRAVELQIASITCWRCRKAIKAIRGYVINNHFVPLAAVSDTSGLTTFVSALRQHVPEVTPVGQRYSHTVEGRYFAASCPFCSALLGDWFMTVDFFTEVASCDYPNCDCPHDDAAPDPRDVGCRVFDYQTTSLRIGPSELCDLPPSEWLWRPATRGANPPRLKPR
jgi:hypothetical protein